MQQDSTLVLAPERQIPGEPGIWVFILGDMLVFTLFFATFLFYRGQNMEMFEASRAMLNRNCGLANTTLLLTSSFFVVTATKAAHRGRVKNYVACLLAAQVCALGFAAIKILEYSDKIRTGIWPGTNEFYAFYYVLTGIHFIHVVIGIGVLLYLLTRARNVAKGTGHEAGIEGGACYWHMVDLLWIIIFPLLYLI